MIPLKRQIKSGIMAHATMAKQGKGQGDAALDQHERMTTEPIRKLTLELGIPSMLSMVITTVYNLVDTWFVARLGTQATAAVGISFAIMEMINSLGYLFGTGGGTRIGLLLGAKDRQSASEVGSTAAAAALGLSLLFSAGGLAFLTPLMRLLGSTPTIQPYAEAYGRLILLGFPVMCLFIVLATFLRCEGKNRLSMIGMGLGGVLNMALDPLFIFGMGLGIAGAALATFLSQTVSLAVLLYFFISGKTETRLAPGAVRPNRRLLGRIICSGLPSLCRHGAGTLSSACLNISAGMHGGDALIAALSIVSKVTAFILALLKGLFQGAQSVYSYNKGAGRGDRIRQAYDFTLRINQIGICLIAAGMYFAAPAVLSLFSATDAETVALGVTALRCHTFGLILMPYGFSVNILLQAVGESGRSTFLASLPQGLCFVPLVFLLPALFGVPGLILTPGAAYLATDLITIPYKKRFVDERYRV